MHRRLPIRTRNPKRYNSIEPGAFERSRIAVPNERDPPAGPDRGVWVQLGPDLALEGEGVSPPGYGRGDDDGRQRQQRSAPLKGQPILTREQSVETWCRDNGHTQRGQEPASFDKFLRGVVTRSLGRRRT